MSKFLSSQHYKQTIILATPILFAHAIEAFIPFINTWMAAHINEVNLAAIGLGNSIFLALMGFCWGIIASVGIYTANKIGAQESNQLKAILMSGLILSFLLGLPVMGIFVMIPPILGHLGQPEEVIVLVDYYFIGLKWAIIADIAKFTIFQFAIACNKPRVPLIANILSIPLLIFINDALTNGRYGLPALGIQGIGYGTAITYWIVFVGMCYYVFVHNSFAQYMSGSIKNIWVVMKELFALGLPIGLMFSIEISFFMVFALLMGRLGVDALAANQITMQWMWMTIIIAYGFAEAVTILIGKNHGAKQYQALKSIAIIGMILSSSFMLVISFGYWIFPSFIIGIDLDILDPNNYKVIELTIVFLAFCGVFQLLDSIRIVTAATLRGIQDTQYPMWSAVIAFWLIGLPLCYYFAFILNWGGVGLWAGLLLAALFNAAMQYSRFYKKILVVKAVA